MAGSGEKVTYRPARRSNPTASRSFSAAGPQGRRPHRALPCREQCPVLRDLLGRPALGADLHRHQLAPDRGRGRLHRDRLRRQAVRHVEISRRPRPPSWRRCLKGVPHRFMIDGTIAGYDSWEGDGGALCPPRRSPTRPPATTCSIRRARPAGPRACCRWSAPQPIDFDNPLLAITRKLYGMDENTIYLSPAPLYHAAPLALQHERHAAGRHLGDHGAFRRRGISCGSSAGTASPTPSSCRPCSCASSSCRTRCG